MLKEGEGATIRPCAHRGACASMEFAAEAGMRTFFTSISIFFVLLVAIVALLSPA